MSALGIHAGRRLDVAQTMGAVAVAGMTLWHELKRHATERWNRTEFASSYLLPIRSPIADTNFGSWLFTSCRIPGLNSWNTFMPASLPIVEPKSLAGRERGRLQYGTQAVLLAALLAAAMWAAVVVSTRSR